MLSSFLQVAAFAATASAIVQPLNTIILGSYGHSPAVYPSPNATGVGGWEAALEKAKAFVAQLTPEEKDIMVTGTPGPCVGNIYPIPRVGFPGICLQDGPLGVRTTDLVSVFPAGVSTASSWDRSLIYARSVAMGEEFKAKGARVALTPVAGPLGRSALGGRNWEGFSPDPYLTGVAMEESIKGIQSVGVQAVAKHFIGNEQETQRNPTFLADAVSHLQESVSSNIDDRTMHELYLWPFANAVHAGVSSVMCSYQRLNGSQACQNSKILNGLLKGELGFQGYVMSDWGATHSGVASIDAGLDMDQPGGLGLYGMVYANGGDGNFAKNVSTAVANGTLAVSRVDDMIVRIMTPYYLLGQDDPEFPTVDPSSVDLNTFHPKRVYIKEWILDGPRSRDVRGNHSVLIREMGAQATILLKNVNNTLPLAKPLSIGIFGNDAGDPTQGYLNQANYEYGTLVVGGGSGTGRLTSIVTPLDALKAKAKEDGAIIQAYLNNTLLATTNISTLVNPTPPDVCLVFLKSWAEEAFDRASFDSDWSGNEVVENVAEYCANTVVITNSAGINNLPFANHPNVTAILAAHFPGEEAGNSIVDLLYGKTNPSGKLPYTIAQNIGDYNAPLTDSINTTGIDDWQSYFEEKLEIDYRHFDAKNISVLYEFGFGLSYTTFEVADLKISKLADAIPASAPAQTAIPGGNPALWESLYTVTVNLKNTGSVAGAEVPQLYISMPGSAPPGTPPKQLRGFEKVKLEAGESQTVSFNLMRRDLSYWDIFSQDWIIPTGEIGLSVGFSSRNLKLSDAITVV
ncbi:hypothetical protein HYFRA_00003974 [Hymenoscyphus fraxineus]|uniref:Probable beta-glucosidase G n=1 Tax=Hymenoscyphus fraxineus TaxID=746836 RepID=A0A9N9PUU5_9HELO|nr:hypothetical protein HYFRA_00003974 [Hymenoscyphus fraxineus]